MNFLKVLLFFLLVIAFPLGEIARFTINEVALTAVDLGVATTVGIWVLKKRGLPKAKLIKPIVIFSSALLLSLLVNTDRLVSNELLISSLYLLRWVFYALLYFVVLDFSAKKSISNWMVMGGFIVLLLGFVQYFLYPDLRNLYYLGWDEHLYRMFSSFLDPNFLGTFFVLYFLFLLNVVVGEKEPKNKIVMIILFLVFIAIVLTFSRSAYIMFIAGLVSFLVLKGKSLLGVLITVVFAVSILIVSTFVLKSEGTNLLRTASGEARIDSVSKALTIIEDNPIFGIGFNSYRYVQRDYGFFDKNNMIIHSGAGTDNSFLFILATSGVLGFIAFIYLWYKIFSIRDPLIVSSSLALIVNSFFINSLFFPLIMLWMWVLIGTRENK